MNIFSGRVVCQFTCGLIFAFGTLEAKAQIDLSNRTIHYTLLNGSYILDDCLICGRPSIFVPIHGGFDVQFGGDTNSLVVTNLAFEGSNYTSSDGHGTAQMTSNGSQQDWHLEITINNGFAIEARSYTNVTMDVTRPLPMIYVVVSQLNSTFTHRYEVGIAAAPLRDIWFSLEHDMNSPSRPPDQILVSRGDILSLTNVVKRAHDLTANFNPTDPFADLGTDALDIRGEHEILFSSNEDFTSNTLGKVGNGDLLNDQGNIIRKNSELMSAFELDPGSGDVGLDAVQVMEEEVLFSIERPVVSNKIGAMLGRGDILSNKGQIIKTGQQLISALHPEVSDGDYGLDALYIWPTGEIWFSVNDTAGSPEGQIGPGDIVSDRGYIVFKNRDLVRLYEPSPVETDYGLDALYVITDLANTAPPLRITQIQISNGQVILTWENSGGSYQVERADEVSGPYTAVSPVIAANTWSDGTLKAMAFYRLKRF